MSIERLLSIRKDWMTKFMTESFENRTGVFCDRSDVVCSANASCSEQPAIARTKLMSGIGTASIEERHPLRRIRYADDTSAVAEPQVRLSRSTNSADGLLVISLQPDQSNLRRLRLGIRLCHKHVRNRQRRCSQSRLRTTVRQTPRGPVALSHKRAGAGLGLCQRHRPWPDRNLPRVFEHVYFTRGQNPPSIPHRRACQLQLRVSRLAWKPRQACRADLCRLSVE